MVVLWGITAIYSSSISPPCCRFRPNQSSAVGRWVAKELWTSAVAAVNIAHSWLSPPLKAWIRGCSLPGSSQRSCLALSSGSFSAWSFTVKRRVSAGWTRRLLMPWMLDRAPAKTCWAYASWGHRREATPIRKAAKASGNSWRSPRTVWRRTWKRTATNQGEGASHPKEERPRLPLLFRRDEHHSRMARSWTSDARIQYRFHLDRGSATK